MPELIFAVGQRFVLQVAYEPEGDAGDGEPEIPEWSIDRRWGADAILRLAGSAHGHSVAFVGHAPGRVLVTARAPSGSVVQQAVTIKPGPRCRRIKLTGIYQEPA